MKTHSNLPEHKNGKQPLENLIKNAVKDFDETAIHKFRLEIKKLKATMQLLRTADKSFDPKKTYRPIRPFYKDLGAVREAQLQQEKFDKNSKGLKTSFQKKYKQALNGELLQREGIVRQKFDKQVIKSLKKINEQVNKAVKDLGKGDFKNYFKVRVQKFKKAIESLDFSQEQMHGLRRLIKEIKFNTQFKKKAAAKWLSKQGIDLAALKDLQEWLGEWHDNVVLKQKLAAQEAALSLQNTEHKALNQFTTSLDVENDLIKDKIKKALMQKRR